MCESTPILQPTNVEVLPISRSIKLLVNYLLGPLLFLAIAFSIYKQLAQQGDLARQWQQLQQDIYRQPFALLIIAVFLVIVNWGIEAIKWQNLVKLIFPCSYLKALLSVLAGVSFTMLTPNRVGEFMGRVLYMPDGSRMRTAALTSIGSLSQIVITLGAGIIALLYGLQHTWLLHNWPLLLLRTLIGGSIAALAVALLLMYNTPVVIKLVQRWKIMQRYQFILDGLAGIQYPFVNRLLVISFLRYVVFLVQYILVFKYAGLSLSVTSIIAGTALMFLLLAIIPTISLAELGIRGQIIIFVFAGLSNDVLRLLIASGIIWGINIILPALAGSLILLTVKLFGK